ncbi:uncharacterized protein LOC123698162 [Colias croceus]|uniref:uncharacterized protein LOC123698162 n=1 Tax=Colias crocea TaxID=72248 RepID=UPI001E27F529|nr:uncharacterized protein LOC123698162 [Colias croceus]
MKNGVGVIVLFGLFQYGLAIVCYECNSALNSICSAAVLPDSLKRNCSDLDRGVTHTLCRKIVQHVEHEINGQMPMSRIIRSCGWDESRYNNTCYHRSGYGGRQEVCSCSKDLCNGSAKISSKHGLISTVVFIFISKFVMF